MPTGIIDSHVEIVVSDSGVGISKEFLPYVFDRFRQADASTTRLHGGLGLGLSIVHQLVDLHGGTVRVPSLLGLKVLVVDDELDTGELIQEVLR